ncbi:hypothetical protein C8D92_102469 [Tamilnaduibacter salinus]|uniref:Sodium:proton antiporter n=1 Tax=Tamilnaduibacter salinus TaxID=1484056 RepID=A0A2A2I6D1_9GAMM|nr:hypothetical protein [Tamilnaduibacter salinus]PAV26685.1 hypothetical protein CF392_04590 [Tamilnaduibacter salinus]PVY78422.1 hypothetical protein C8D92_102469 [Tamilnaduibacter salinus]
MAPEAAVLLLNVAVIVVAYGLVYPAFAAGNLRRLAVNDLVATAIPLTVVGSVFWGTDESFNALVIDLNWFWFTLLTFFAIEAPFMVWYFRRYQVFDDQ